MSKDKGGKREIKKPKQNKNAKIKNTTSSSYSNQPEKK